MASLLWTFCSLCFAAAARRIGALSLNAYRLTLAVGLLGGTHILLLGSLVPDASQSQWFYLALSGIVGLTVGDFAYFAALSYIGPRKGVLLLGQAPIFTLIAAYLILDELPGFWNLVGIGVTLAGVFIVLMEKREPGASDEEARDRDRYQGGSEVTRTLAGEAGEADEAPLKALSKARAGEAGTEAGAKAVIETEVLAKTKYEEQTRAGELEGQASMTKDAGDAGAEEAGVEDGGTEAEGTGSARDENADTEDVGMETGRVATPPATVACAVPTASSAMDVDEHSLTPRQKAYGITLGLIAAIGQGVGLVIAGLGNEDVDPLSVAFIRIIAGCLAVWMVILITGRFRQVLRRSRDRQGLALASLGAFFGPFLGVWSIMVAIANTYTGIAATLSSLAPVFIIPVLWFVFHQRTGWRGFLGAAVSVIGVAIIFLL